LHPGDATPIWRNIICTFGLISKIGKNNPNVPKNEKNNPDHCPAETWNACIWHKTRDTCTARWKSELSKIFSTIRLSGKTSKKFQPMY
jgi:hypothetical protein